MLAVDQSPAPELEDHQTMHVHKIKPVHGWKEFLSEIVIIVIGVLIAIGAEQAVEAMHWAHEVEAQRQSLNAEARDNLGAVARREVQQPCVSRRLAEIRQVLERHAAQKPLGITGSFAQPTQAGSIRGSWNIALSGQAMSHMSQDERLKFSQVFGTFSSWQDDTDREYAIWSRLSLLKDVALLNDGDWTTLHGAYAEAVGMNESRGNFASYISRTIGRQMLGMAGKPVASNSTYAELDRQICKPYVAASPRE